MNENDDFLACAVCGSARDALAALGRGGGGAAPAPPPKPAHLRTASASSAGSAPPAFLTPRPQSVSAGTPPTSPLAMRRDHGALGVPGRPVSPLVMVDSSESKARQMNSLFDELLETERTYVNDVGVIVTRFLQPLKQLDGAQSPRSSKHHILSPQDIRAIFSNIEELMRVNMELLSAMEEQLGVHGPDGKATAFMKAFEIVLPHFKMYSTYVINYNKAIETLKDRERSNKSFREFLKSVSHQSDTRMLPLSSYLIKPVQRICKYPLFFQNLLKLTDTTHPSYGSIVKAMEVVSKITENVDLDKAKAERNSRSFEISQRLEPSLQSASQNGHRLRVMEPGRQFVGEWRALFSKGDSNISKRRSSRSSRMSLSAAISGNNNNQKQRLFFLYSNLLVVAKEVSSSRYDLRNWIDMSELLVKLLDDRPLGDASSSSSRQPLFPLEIVHIANAKGMGSSRSQHGGGPSSPSSVGGMGGDPGLPPLPGLDGVTGSSSTSIASTNSISNASASGSLGSRRSSFSLGPGGRNKARKASATVMTTYTMYFTSNEERRRVWELLSSTKDEWTKMRDSYAKKRNSLTSEDDLMVRRTRSIDVEPPTAQNHHIVPPPTAPRPKSMGAALGAASARAALGPKPPAGGARNGVGPSAGRPGRSRKPRPPPPPPPPAEVHYFDPFAGLPGSSGRGHGNGAGAPPPPPPNKPTLGGNKAAPAPVPALAPVPAPAPAPAPAPTMRASGSAGLGQAQITVTPIDPAVPENQDPYVRKWFPGVAVA